MPRPYMQLNRESLSQTLTMSPIFAAKLERCPNRLKQTSNTRKALIRWMFYILSEKGSIFRNTMVTMFTISAAIRWGFNRRVLTT